MEKKNLSKDFKTVAKSFYTAVKAMRRTENHDPTEQINVREGQPISNKDKTLQRWKEYFDNLLNTTPDRNKSAQPMQKDTEQEPGIHKEKIAKAIKSAGKNKDLGIDNISLELIIAAGEAGLSWLHRIFNSAWSQQIAPDDWRKAIIVPIWKGKDSKRDCKQYRGISLLSHAGKLYAKFLEKKTDHSWNNN